MENHFTFIKSPEITTLNHALELMPGLMQVDLLVKKDYNERINIFSLKDKGGVVSQIRLKKNIIFDLSIFHNTIKSVSWYQLEDLPYSEISFEKKGNDLFSELDKNILIIPIKTLEEMPELVYVFRFRKNASELGPVSSKNVLETSHKQLIGRLLLNSLKAMLNSIVENRKVMQEYNKVLTGLIKSKDSRIEQQEEKTLELESYLTSILNEYVREFTTDYDGIVIPEKTKQILFPYLSNPDLIKKYLHKSINFAHTFSFMQASSKLELLPEYFNDLVKEQSNKSREPQAENDIYSTHTKTYQFLDSLENAANKVIHRGGKLTSINVGQELEQPVTAAAISDKLKNHAYKIHLLLKQFPDMWPIVRNQFRPVINIQEKQAREKFAS